MLWLCERIATALEISDHLRVIRSIESCLSKFQHITPRTPSEPMKTCPRFGKGRLIKAFAMNSGMDRAAKPRQKNSAEPPSPVFGSVAAFNSGMDRVGTLVKICVMARRNRASFWICVLLVPGANERENGKGGVRAKCPAKVLPERSWISPIPEVSKGKAANSPINEPS
jgi:hypothetical protein